jgi:hypothetical protein
LRILHDNNPIIPEYTAEYHNAFYLRLGFEIMGEAELADNDGTVELWFMLRPGVSKNKHRLDQSTRPKYHGSS